MFKEDIMSYKNFPFEMIHRRHFFEDLEGFLIQSGIKDFLNSFDSIPLDREAQIVEIFDDNGKTNAIRVPGRKASRLFDAGHASVRFRCMDHHNSALNKMRLNLQEKLPFKVARSYVNGFLSKAGTQGTEHFDGHEVLVMQLKGFKKWTLSRPKNFSNPNVGWGVESSLEALKPLGVEDDSFFTEREIVSEIVLGPGDILFMPRGLFHLTETIQDSFHITMSIEGLTKADLILDKVRELIQREDSLRAVHREGDGIDLSKFRELLDCDFEIKVQDPDKAVDRQNSKKLQLTWNEAFSLKNSKLLGPDKYSITFFKGTRFFEEVMVDEKELTIINYLKDRKTAFDVESIVQTFDKIRPQKIHRIISYLVENLTLNTALGV